VGQCTGFPMCEQNHPIGAEQAGGMTGALTGEGVGVAMRRWAAQCVGLLYPSGWLGWGRRDQRKLGLGREYLCGGRPCGASEP
jgi:hypothetical protein